MSDDTNFMMQLFDRMASKGFNELAAKFTDQPEPAMARARERFEALTETMAYRDQPDHPMAMSVYFTHVQLAFFLVLRDEGASAHDYGAAMLAYMTANPRPLPEEPPTTPPDAFFDAAIASQSSAKPEEFVFDAERTGDGENDWVMNIRSCAICHSFSKHDAMDLVPYMCATDDVESVHMNQGLHRSGSIAVGATHCDFRFKRDRETLSLASQYPDRIRVAAD